MVVLAPMAWLSVTAQVTAHSTFTAHSHSIVTAHAYLTQYVPCSGARADGVARSFACPVPPLDHLHAAVLDGGVDERDPDRQHLLVPYPGLPVAVVLMPWHHGLLVGWHFATQVPRGVQCDVWPDPELRGDIENFVRAEELLERAWEHAAFDENDRGVREVLPHPKEPRGPVQVLKTCIGPVSECARVCVRMNE